jgi:23S rRNA (pseudouridine1915-N3)-methyltransferase
MILRFLWVGKTKNKHLAALEQEYLARIEHFGRSHVQVVRETKGVQGLDMERRIVASEGETILKALRPEAYVVLLDAQGHSLTSEGLARLIAERQNEGTKEMAFVVGGHWGTAKAVGQRADFKLSLSRMTFSHELTRVVLLEQVYRAFAIIHGLPYPK